MRCHAAASVALALACATFASSAAAQDPAEAVALALLRGDAAAAARAAGRAEPAALRARLLAALHTGGDRAVAMLAVAQGFPASPEADRALLAGAAAALTELGLGEAVPDLVTFEAHERGDSRLDFDVLSPVVISLRAAVAARRAAGGDGALLAEAERLLGLATVVRHGLLPVRVPLANSWQRPPELREPLSLRLLPCGPGSLPWSQVDALAAPSWTAVLPIDGPVTLPPLPAGDWLLETRSSVSPWRGMRRVLVSDLEAIALAQDGQFALAAFDPRGVAAAQWELVQDGTTAANGALAAKAQLWPGKAMPAPAVAHSELRLRAPCGTTWLHCHGGLDTAAPDGARWLLHAMVDRPVYRPGETLQGRIVLRRCTWEGEGMAQVPSTAPAAGCAVQMAVGFGDAGTLTLPLRTDDHGLAAFSCVVPAAAEPGTPASLSLLLPETDANGKPLRLGVGELGAVAFFQRQAVALDVEGPESVAAGQASVDVAVRAAWASGGPAAGLDVRAAVNARDGWEREEALVLRTDADGRATVRVPIAGTGARWVNVDFTVTPPDGRSLTAHHMLQVQPAADEAAAAAAAAAKPGWLEARVPELELGAAVVGAPCRITLRGAPGLPVLVVVGRSSHARVHAMRFGADGVVTIDEPVLRCDWPRFDVAAASGAGHRQREVPVRLRAMAEPRLEVPAQAGPGAEVSLRVVGDAPAALVTFAVVDERIYEMAADRTPEPDAALRPDLPHPGWRAFATPSTSTPVDLLDSLLVHGRLPDLRWRRNLSAWPGAGGGASPGPSGPQGAVRTRFCPTAHFATVVADAAGVATTSFRLPDDLTRWRATAVVIGRDGVGSIARQSFASRQPLAVEPVLPRVLRAGDTLRLPLAIDRAGDAKADGDAAKVTAAVTGSALVVDRGEATVTVPAGRVVATDVPLRAVQVGTSTLQLGVQLAAHADRSERALAVVADAMVHPVAAAASGRGVVTLGLPDGAAADGGLAVDVLAGGAEAWRLLEQDLARYPYGCAEQTLSRLLPFFALVRASKLRGETPPAMDEAFGKRLRAGLARLRGLQPTSSRHFAFWPGQDPDDGITALVLHGLSLLRQGGVDLERSGLDLKDYSFRESLPRTRGVVVVDAAFVHAAELLAGELRLWPEDATARGWLQPALEVLPQLPVGLCARLGLALQAAGDDAGARACRQRLGDGSLPALAADAFPGEDPLAVQALRLELDVALHADAAACERAAAELLLACLRGDGSTYGRACALTALALVLPRTTAPPATVVVEAAGERRVLRLGGDDGAAARCLLPRGGPVTVRGPDGLPLLVRVTAERRARASDHAAWASPIAVQRQWCTSRLDARWDERRNGRDLVPWMGPPQVGHPLVLHLLLRSPQAMRHVVVDCPLPAGFDLQESVEGCERFDDRVVFATDLQAGVAREFRIVVVPTMVGRFVFPPVVAAPMYASGCEGGCAGGFVEVVPVAPGSVPSLLSCMVGPRRLLAPPPDPFGDCCSALRDARDGSGDDGELLSEEVRAQRVEVLLAAVPPLDGDPFRQVEELRWLATCADLEEDGAKWPERAWRVALQARLQALLVGRLQAALATPCPANRDAARRQCGDLQRALYELPADAARERFVVQWRQRAIACGLPPEAFVDLLSVPPRDPGLVAALRALASTSTGAQFQSVWALLPAEERALVPPARVLDAPQDVLAPGLLGWLLTTAAGEAEVRVRLCDPSFVALQWERLAAELPAALWAAVPLPAFATVAVTAVGEMEDDEDQAAVVDAIVARLAQGAASPGELLAALLSAKVPAWRYVLALALRARGAGAVPEPATAAVDDAFAPLWGRALRLAGNDAAAAGALLAALPGRKDVEVLDGEALLLARIPAAVLAASGTPLQVYAARTALQPRDWQAAWARFGEADRIALLAQFHKHIAAAFVPATVGEAEAVFAFFTRSGDVDGTATVLGRSWVGMECARRHLLADERSPHAAELRAALAEAWDLDPATLQAEPAAVFAALLTRLKLAGFAGAFTSDEAQRLQRVRAQRGL